MQRREFLRVLGAGGAVVAFSDHDRCAAARLARHADGISPADLAWANASGCVSSARTA